MIMGNEIIIRDVYGKVNQITYVQPCPDPKTGRLPECVKPINSNGDMILSEKDVADMSAGLKHFIPADFTFEIVDGTVFDLDDIVDKAKWEAIKHCNWIAKDRAERNANGELVIDGNAKRYGNAFLYVERPGEIAKQKVSKAELVFNAQKYIFEDSEQNRVKKAKVLGRNLERAAKADILEYLLDMANKNPQKIIDLYEGEEWKTHLFIIDALERGVIRKGEGLFKYDDKMLGATMEATSAFLRDFRNKAIKASIQRETYPELLPKDQQDEIKEQINNDFNEIAETKPTKKK